MSTRSSPWFRTQDRNLRSGEGGIQLVAGHTQSNVRLPAPRPGSGLDPDAQLAEQDP